ncbi:type II toxin-antitoxin system RelE/ParE family toxin [Flavobacterium undicola]|jgi:plasmid stabilization system protein ParE|uniref:type II toxin-antitoxin system RelE/ParE family toxin n=1 Tax=Flavobacterium undicola TaxID=1932779 RepID=UPI0013775882|nr:type II toxin-antitoxin system RelE/ParE family toxin [Flavobacterium undicola]MBA0883575.1 type II toxin-antitoxin system RelE/ParE family toxin [Flavobacterium undicola]
MKREIIFSKNAEKSLIDLLGYLELKWSIKVRDKFISKLDKSIYLIQNEPEVFPKSQINKNQHRCVLSKQTTIYYSYNSKQIRILALFDTRQNPLKINKIK